MINMKRFVVIAAVAAVLGTAGAAFAATTRTPVDIAAELTGRTAEELYEETAEGKTYGAIAKDAGKLDEFKQQMLEQKKSILDQRVTNGEITREQADEIYKEVENRQAYCDGTGNPTIGNINGTCFGQGSGMGNGRRAGRGAGMHYGRGMRR